MRENGLVDAGKMRSALGPAAAIWLILSLWGPAAQAETTDCNAADPDQVRLQVAVTGMHSTKGLVSITIYPDDSSHFLDGAYKLARQEVPVTQPTTTACFVVARPGYYAVALFHDENSNGHFDTTLFGLPAEGYGFSNNPTLYLGPPDLSRVRIAAHAGDNPVAVQMKYY